MSSDVPENEENDHEVDPQTDFPALSITFAEAQRRYDDEEQRRDSLESKTSMVIGINALVISLASAFLQQGPIVTAIILSPALFSAYLGLRILEIRNYERPGKDISDFFQYAKKDPAEVEDTLLISYMRAVEENKTKNDEKVDDFVKSYWLTLISIALIVVIPIVQLVISLLVSYLTYLANFYF